MRSCVMWQVALRLPSDLKQSHDAFALSACWAHDLMISSGRTSEPPWLASLQVKPAHHHHHRQDTMRSVCRSQNSVASTKASRKLLARFSVHDAADPRRKGGGEWVLRIEFLVIAGLSQAYQIFSTSHCLKNTTFAVDCVHLPNTYPNITDKWIHQSPIRHLTCFRPASRRWVWRTLSVCAYG